LTGIKIFIERITPAVSAAGCFSEPVFNLLLDFGRGRNRIEATIQKGGLIYGYPLCGKPERCKTLYDRGTEK
jgi:hypothetical protein